MSFKWLGAMIAVGALAACAPASSMPDTSTGQDANPADAVVADTPMPPRDADPMACVYPHDRTNPDLFGNIEGRPFRPFVLPNCDTSAGDYDFAGPEFCRSQLTLIVFSAGWCGPCRAEAPMIEQYIQQGYTREQVRVIVIYGQNTDYSPPSVVECNRWRTMYGLTNTMLIDPMGMTTIYFPNMAYPANLIVDRRGNIRYRIYGASAGLTTLRNTIDRLLAE